MRPVAVARLRWIACSRSADSGVGRRDFGAHDVLMVQQALAERVGEVGQDDQAIALGEQQQRLADDRQHAGLRDDLGDGGALARRGHRRIQQHLAQRRRLLGERGSPESPSSASIAARSACSLSATSSSARA